MLLFVHQNTSDRQDMFIKRKWTAEAMKELAAATRGANSRTPGELHVLRMPHHLPDRGLERRPIMGEASAADSSSSIAAQIPNFGMALKGLFDLWLDERLPSLKEDMDRRYAADTIGKVRLLVSRLGFPEQIRRIMARVEDGGLVEILVVHKYESPGEAIDAVRRDFRVVDPAVPGAYFEFTYVESERFEEADFSGFVDVLAW